MGNLILLVDDSVADAVLTELALQRSGQGSELEVLRRGEEAISRLLSPDCARRKPDLVILDIKLPGMNGHEVLSTLRDAPELEDTPIVMFSSSQHPADRTRSEAAGADAYFTKPYGLESYDAVVRELETRWCLSAN